GAGLSQVRIHRDTPAAEAAEALNATAFTAGRDVYFAAGKYAPGRSEGQRLLAHELAHTIQQSNGQEPTKLAPKAAGGAVDNPDAAREREADAAADRVMAQGAPSAPPAPADDVRAPDKESAPAKPEKKAEEQKPAAVKPPAAEEAKKAEKKGE